VPGNQKGASSWWGCQKPRDFRKNIVPGDAKNGATARTNGELKINPRDRRQNGVFSTATGCTERRKWRGEARQKSAPSKNQKRRSKRKGAAEHSGTGPGGLKKRRTLCLEVTNQGFVNLPTQKGFVNFSYSGLGRSNSKDIRFGRRGIKQ